MLKKLILSIVAFVAFVGSSCATVRGSGNVVFEDRDAQNFTRVIVNGQVQLLLLQGDKESLRIEAEENMIPLIETSVVDGTLFINGEEVGTAVPTVPIKIHITIKEIVSLESSGLSYIDAANLKVDQLQITGNAYGKIEIDALIANQVIIHLREDSNVELKGEVVNQEIDVADHADYRAAALNSQTATVHVAGQGTATIQVEESLRGIVNQNGDVLYYGSPETNLDVTDSGKVKNREE